MKKFLTALMVLGFVFLNLFGCKQSDVKVKNEPTETPIEETLPSDSDIIKPVDINKMKSIVDNNSSYNKLSGRIYSKDDIKPFYIPFRVKSLFQREFTFNDINNILEIKFLRDHSLGFYTYFDLEHSRFFVFFDNKGVVSSMFNYPLNPVRIDDFKALEKRKSTIEDVLNIDESTFVYDAVAEIINEDRKPREEPISEHLVAEGYILEIEYIRENDSLVVSKVKINHEFLPAVDKNPYFDDIYSVYP